MNAPAFSQREKIDVCLVLIYSASMADNINFPQGNIQSSIQQVAKHELAKRQNQQAEPKFVKPARAEENYVPENETIFTMVRSALAALKQGATFDRGSIVNLVV